MKVLVFGGNRYIGLRLVFELARQGHDVTVVNSHEAPLPAGARRLHGNRHEPGVLEQVLGPLRDEFDAVFDNTAYTPEHLEPVVELFRGRVRHFVFTSSVAVYEPATIQPIDETYPVGRDPATATYGPYAAGKVHCEELLLREHAGRGLPVTCLRVSHSCGPSSPAVSREPGTFKRLEEGRPLILAGRVDALIDVIHIDDIARGIAAPLGRAEAAGRIYNIAAGRVCSIRDYVRLMADAAGVEPRIVVMPTDMPGHMRSPIVHWLEANHGSMIFSIERARAELGWAPTMTLPEGLADSYCWFREEGRGRYQYDYAPDEEIMAEIERRGGVAALTAGAARAVERPELQLKNIGSNA